MNEAEIAALLSVEEGTEKISALVPRKLLDRMLRDYREKVGAVKEHGLRSAALFYFAARGVLSWEASGAVVTKTPPQPARGKKRARPGSTAAAPSSRGAGNV